MLAKLFVAFLIYVVLIFVLPGFFPRGVSPTVVLGLLALVFVPSLRKFALGLIIGLIALGLIGSALYSTVNKEYQAAKSRFGAPSTDAIAASGAPPSSAAQSSAAPASSAPAPAAGGFENWTRGLLAEDWKPFIAGRTWKTTVGLEPRPCCIQSGDVQQGHLGDCWLLASLAAVARTSPALIKRAIQSNDDGTYTVTLFAPRSGGFAQREVRVSAAFPEYQTTLFQRFFVNDSRFAYAQPGDASDEAWVMLIEKAAAAVYGGYENLDGDAIVNGSKVGTGINGLQLVTGRAVKSFEPRKMKPDALAAKLTELEMERYPVIVGTFASNQSAETGSNPMLVKTDEDPALSTGHMYYFVHYEPSTATVTVGNQHERTTQDLTLQQFQFAFAGVFYNDAFSSEDGCTCQ